MNRALCVAMIGCDRSSGIRSPVMVHAHAVASAAVLACLLALRPVQAQSVTFTSGPLPLAVNNASPGSEPVNSTTSTARMTLVVTTADSRLSVNLEAPLASNIPLSVQVQTVSGAFSSGPVVLDTAPRDLLTGIPVGNYVGLIVTYTLSAKSAAGTILPTTSNVVFTLGNGP